MHPTRLLFAAALCVLGALPLAIRQPAAQMQLDFNQIFRCVEGTPIGPAECDHARELITFNCTVCHLFVRIVMKQGTPTDWNATIERHRSRMPDITTADMDAMRDYLAANFRPDLPPPDVPPELLQEIDNPL